MWEHGKNTITGRCKELDGKGVRHTKGRYLHKLYEDYSHWRMGGGMWMRKEI